ncbi:MAG: endolytic transglycosylase MltG, partial [bacterium]
MKKKIILLSFAIFLILLLFGLTLTYILFSKNSNLAEDTSRVVIVPRGKNVNQIAELLKERDVIANTRKFVWSAKILRRANHLKAGRYEIIGGKSSSDIVEIFYQGRVSSIRVMIPEGLDSGRIASIYSEKLNIDTQ